MQPVTHETDDASATERELATSIPFGNYDYISDRLSHVYTHLLSLIALESSAARAFLDVLIDLDQESRGAVLRDSLTRRTIEDGVCKAVRGLDTIEPSMLDELLSAAAEKAQTGGRPLLDQDSSCTPLKLGSRRGYLWQDDEFGTLAGRRFGEEVLSRLPGFRLHRLDASQIDTLIDSCILAEKIAPNLSRSAISHCFMVLVGRVEPGEQFNSVTVPGLPGVIILSPEVLATRTDAAEALLHESLHLKFLDIDYIHPLFIPGFRQETSPRTTPIWHKDRPGYGNWPVDRVLTSMHVYLALAVFLKRASLGPFDEIRPKECETRAMQCKSRAAWLFDNARNHFEVLTPAGREFVAKVGTMLAELDLGEDSAPL